LFTFNIKKHIHNTEYNKINVQTQIEKKVKKIGITISFYE